MNRIKIFTAINAERARQDKLHPKWHGNDHGSAVLAEEFGEVARALYEYNEKRRFMFDIDADNLEELQRRRGELQDELIQVAAVAVRWLENM